MLQEIPYFKCIYNTNKIYSPIYSDMAHISFSDLFMTHYLRNTLVYSRKLAEQKFLISIYIYWEHNKSVSFLFSVRQIFFFLDRILKIFFPEEKTLYSSENQHKLMLVFSPHTQFNFSLLRYDPKTDTWTMVAPLSMPRDAVGVCLLGDKLYAVGGYDGQSYLNTMEAYDPQTNEWTQVIIKFILYIHVCTHTHTHIYVWIKHCKVFLT